MKRDGVMSALAADWVAAMRTALADPAEALRQEPLRCLSDVVLLPHCVDALLWPTAPGVLNARCMRAVGLGS